MSVKIFPIILAGGSGTRLWPLSRKNFPKQFLCLQGEGSLLQQTLERALSLSPEKILIVSNDAHYFLCQEQLKTYAASITYLLEPIARNTAPAMAAAAHYLIETAGPDAIMLIMPSDHLIEDTLLFRKAMIDAAELCSLHDMLITFGIKPNSPNTGYGYIKASEVSTTPAFEVEAFIEKPNLENAEAMVAEGNYYWNSGMLACRADVYLRELERFAPNIVACSKKAVMNAYQHHDFLRLELDAMTECPSVSNDYALLEHTEKTHLIPLSFSWSDLGCWNSVSNANEKDEDGNIITGNVLAKNSRNCLIRSEHMLVTTMGIEDKIIVATHDAVLVADKSYSQQVKDLVEKLRENHQPLLDDHPRVPRPWGHFEILAEGPSFKVKRLMVHPGSSLSLQIHQHRAEHWVVVAGVADIINGDKTLRLTVNQSTYIPKQTRHRLANTGDVPLFVIEVQSGEYLGEDDIQRLEDVYQRSVTAS